MTRHCLARGARLRRGTGSDLAYTVGFERGQVSVDSNAPSMMTICVTHIYRRIDGEWYLVHRHADFPPSDRRARDQGTAGPGRA